MQTQTLTFEINNITYGRKVVDRGVILGKRPYKWTLYETNAPLAAHDLDNKRKVSIFSKQKHDFFVYIPAAELECGQTLRIIQQDDRAAARREQIVKVRQVTPHFIETDIIACQEYSPADLAARRREIVERRLKKRAVTMPLMSGQDGVEYIFGGVPSHDRDSVVLTGAGIMNDTSFEFGANVTPQAQEQPVDAPAPPQPVKLTSFSPFLTMRKKVVAARRETREIGRVGMVDDAVCLIIDRMVAMTGAFQGADWFLPVRVDRDGETVKIGEVCHGQLDPVWEMVQVNGAWAVKSLTMAGFSKTVKQNPKIVGVANEWFLARGAW